MGTKHCDSSTRIVWYSHELVQSNYQKKVRPKKILCQENEQPTRILTQRKSNKIYERYPVSTLPSEPHHPVRFTNPIHSFPHSHVPRGSIERLNQEKREDIRARERWE